MTIPPETLILMALVVFVGYTIFGAPGFGASPITIPVLAHVLPLTFVLSLAARLDLSSGLALGFHTRKQADTRELLALLPFTLVGLTLGVALLVKLPRNATVLALGVFVCVYALHMILRRGPARRLSRLWVAPAGVLGGIIGALFDMGGPALRRLHHGPRPRPRGPARDDLADLEHDRAHGRYRPGWATHAAQGRDPNGFRNQRAGEAQHVSDIVL